MAGRFFFIWMGVCQTSRAPAAKSWSMANPSCSPVALSMLVSRRMTLSCQRAKGALGSGVGDGSFAVWLR